MKNYILSAFFFLSILNIHAQSGNKSVTVDSKEYEQMKKSGTFPAGIKINNAQSFTPSLEDLKQLGEVHKMPAGGASGCSCYITPDGSYTLAMAPNDDGSTASISIPFNFCLYGTNYTSLFINNNGNISFGTAYSTFTAAGFPDPAYVMVAPFWGDVDTRTASGTGSLGTVKYKITPTAMYVNWDNVGYYSTHGDLRNTFQLIITNGADPILPNGNNIAFCYQDMQWTTGDASSGVGGFGGFPATVGVNKGDGTNYIQMGTFDQPGMAYDGGYGLNDGVSWLDYQSFYFNVCSGSNIAPIASGLNNCDTIRICGSGDTLILNGLFLSPEIGQNTTLNINLNSTPGATIISNTPGNSANGQVQIIASVANAGNNVITFTATDNGTPTGVTTVNVNIYVDTTGLFAFNPAISGVLEFCEGSTSTLSVTPTTLDSYYWNTGSTGTSIVVDSSGQYWVTTEKNGCYKTNLVDVVVNPSPTPVIAGYPYACGGTTTIYADSSIYSSYSWSNGSTNDSITVGLGTYTLTVTDTNGCTGTSPAVTVTAPVPPVITGVTAICNGDSAVLTTTIPYSTYSWSTGSTNDSITVGTTGSYSVTVVDVNGCTINSAPFNVTTFNFTFGASGVTNFCSGSSITLSATSSPSGGAYSWSNGAGTSSTAVNAGGNYTVTVTYPNGCNADTTLNVPTPYPSPTPEITGALFTCGLGSTTISVDSATLYTSITWSDLSTGNSVTTNSGTYTVTVTGANGCTGTSPAVTVINANPTVDITGAQSFCPGDSAVLFANVNLPSGASYLWSTSETTPSIVVTTSGTYSVAISYSNGCSTSDSESVNVYSAPVANFSISPSVSAFMGTPVSFTDLSGVSPGSITTWNWNFGDSLGSVSSLQNPVHIYSVNGVYQVTLAVQSNNGCWDTVMVDYTIISEVLVPNVFTPNGDGKNDLLVFKNLEFFPNSALTIYNRWGKKIYKSDDYQNNWGGENHSDGVYYYILEGPQLKETRYGFVQIFNEK
jgi:gliding motility-associated-like protein